MRQYSVWFRWLDCERGLGGLSLQEAKRIYADLKDRVILGSLHENVRVVWDVDNRVIPLTG
jgi:hypothetical protein